MVFFAILYDYVRLSIYDIILQLALALYSPQNTIKRQPELLIHSNDEKEITKCDDLWFGIIFWYQRRATSTRSFQEEPSFSTSSRHGLQNAPQNALHHYLDIQDHLIYTWKRYVFIFTQDSLRHRRLCNHSCKYYIYIIINTPFKDKDGKSSAKLLRGFHVFSGNICLLSLQQLSLSLSLSLSLFNQ